MKIEGQGTIPKAKAGVPPATPRPQDFERAKWDDYFEVALQGKGQEHEKSLFWRLADEHSVDVVKRAVDGRRGLTVAEAGCGSGDMTMMLASHLSVAKAALFDLSDKALELAKRNAAKANIGQCDFRLADIEHLPVSNDTYDVCWNVGVIEHYPADHIERMVREMWRVTKPGGALICAIPNRRSIATLKAWALGSEFGRRYLNWIPGYRFDSEILYSDDEMAQILALATGTSVHVEHAGGPLWVSAPDWLAAAANWALGRSRVCFLSFFVAKKV
jgi:2-polyprenyl-3-methyl-5-hydroxy-6-metoxy-1,4-benzoquinol methylase